MEQTYRRQRGYHHWVCLVCGKREWEAIPDQADDRYDHNPGNPWLAVCGSCNGGSPSAGIRLGNSALRPQPHLDGETQMPVLDGEWGEYWQIARRFEHKAPGQDREDLRHNIIVRLFEVARAKEAKGKVFTEAGKLRTASLVVMDWWDRLNKGSTRVCILSGIAKKPDHAKCSFEHKPQSCAQCPYRAIRPISSLNLEIEDGEGHTTELWETIADDRAIDLDAWVDHRVWLMGCPKRLIEIAHKKKNGIALDLADRLYLCRWRQREQKRLF